MSAIITDAHPRSRSRAGYVESDRITTLDLPSDGRLPHLTKSIDTAMQSGKTADVRHACTDFLAEASRLY